MKKSSFMKFLFCWMLIIAVTAMFTVLASAETVTGKCGDNVSYTLDTETHVLTISGSGAMYEYKYSFDTPWEKQVSENHRSFLFVHLLSVQVLQMYPE